MKRNDGLDPDEARAMRACDRAAEAVAELEPERWEECLMQIALRLRRKTTADQYLNFVGDLYHRIDYWYSKLLEP